jgi:hypothetical protein
MTTAGWYGDETAGSGYEQSDKINLKVEEKRHDLRTSE